MLLLSQQFFKFSLIYLRKNILFLLLESLVRRFKIKQSAHFFVLAFEQTLSSIF